MGTVMGMMDWGVEEGGGGGGLLLLYRSRRNKYMS